jgi:hypothetical protein
MVLWRRNVGRLAGPNTPARSDPAVRAMSPSRPSQVSPSYDGGMSSDPYDRTRANVSEAAGGVTAEEHDEIEFLSWLFRRYVCNLPRKKAEERIRPISASDHSNHKKSFNAHPIVDRPRALHRAGGRALSGWKALDRVPAWVLSARARPLIAVPGFASWQARCRP